MESFSQYKQDIFIYENFFKNKTDGFFVDIGAHDGITLSNTYLFENKMNWTGVCFEPNQKVFEKLKQNRPRSVCYDCGVGDHDGLSVFVSIDGYSEMLSGVLDQYHPDHLNRINNEINQFGGKVENTEIWICQLKSVLNRKQHIDYLSIDTEGGEDKILFNILVDYSPDVVSVEANYQKDFDNIHRVMISKNYSLITNLNVDYIYKRNQ